MTATVSSVSLAARATLWLVSGVAGAVLFWAVQLVAGGTAITEFMGRQIAGVAGYPAGVAPAIGWAVHLGVSLSYALLFGVIVTLLAKMRLPAQAGISLVAAAALGWVTTVVAPPAIGVTISVLGLQGWPATLFPPNTEIGLPLWNHVGFFLLNWVLQALGPGVLGSTETRLAP
jgi:hypothetical protein